MPGIITHTITGILLSVIGRFYFKNYFESEYKKQIILVITCLLFSILPDIFLGAYYTTHILSYEILVPYHTITHIAFTPIAFFILILMRVDTKRKPFWAMALWSIIFHLAMDLIIEETGPLF